MNIQEALNVFGINGTDLSKDDLKNSYRKLALKYHPDRNPLGVELMKAVNAAFDLLMMHFDKISQVSSNVENSAYNYGEELERVLTELNGLDGIVFEVIGNWVWIDGETKKHKEELKTLGCKWASKKQKWFYRPEEHKSTWNRAELSIEEIREMYGTNGTRKAKGRYRVESHA
ncbi:J domain-containing protein [Erwinia amylovora]